MENDVIEIEHIVKKYKDVYALKDVSLSIGENMLFGLLGVNGAGKTTLIKILSGLCPKDEGKVHICGYDIDKDISKIHSLINLSPQETALCVNLDVIENLRFFMDIYSKRDEEYLKELVMMFSLQDVLNKKVKHLSGGFQRRLSLAIALVSKPKVLFLDEPTLGLDVISRRQLWKILERLKHGMTILLTSHYLEEMEALSDKVAILSKGRILSQGSVQEIKMKEKASTLEEAFLSLVEGEDR